MTPAPPLLTPPGTHPMTHPPRPPRPPRPHPRAFTLTELVLAAAVTAILLLASQAAIVIAAKAVPDGRGRASAAVAAGAALDQFAADASDALLVFQAADRHFEFLVPDRNGDGEKERIAYRWSGVRDEPLTRAVNGGTPAVVADGVISLKFVYDAETHTQPMPDSEAAESLLSSYWTTSSEEVTVHSTRSVGQFFRPSLPANAIEWRITRIAFRARIDSKDDGQYLVEVRPANRNELPTAQVLASAPRLERDLDSSAAKVFQAFDKVGPFRAGEGATFMLVHVQNDASLAATFKTALILGSASGMIQTSSGGLLSLLTDKSLLYEVWGTYTTPGVPVSTSRLRSVRLNLRNGDKGASTLETSVRTFNRPVLP